VRAVVLVCVLAPLLAGCGIPDLVAHTVKAVEKSQREPVPQASAPVADSSPAAANASQNRVEEAPPPAAAPAYAPAPRTGGGGGITVEELPPR